MGIAQFAYVGVHLPVMLGVLAWTWFARPRAFPLGPQHLRARAGARSLGYVLVPTAPPRMVPEAGYGAGRRQTGPRARALAMSPYAAMPSGHAAFALIAAGIVATQARSRAVRVLAVLYPAVGWGSHGHGQSPVARRGRRATVAAAAFALAGGLSAVRMSRRLRGAPMRSVRAPAGAGGPDRRLLKAVTVLSERAPSLRPTL